MVSDVFVSVGSRDVQPLFGLDWAGGECERCVWLGGIGRAGGSYL